MHAEEAATRRRPPLARADYAWLAGGLPLVLLLIAAPYRGAFAIRHWAPVAILALTVLGTAALAGGSRVPERWTRVALGAAWALTLWALLSVAWAYAPADALVGASRTALYAALFTIPCALLSQGRSAARLGGVLVVGIGAIAVVTLVRLIADGSELFLAGRLDDPVGYRNATGCLFALGFWPFVAVAARHDANAWLRAVAGGGAALALGLAFLTQARGVWLALAAGGIVALALGPDRLRRAWVAIGVVGALALAWGPLLTPYRRFADTGLEATQGDVARAVDTLVPLIGVVFAIGLAIALLDGGLRLRGRARDSLRAALEAGLALVVAGVLVGGLLVAGDPVEFVEARASEFRDIEAGPPGETRLTFGGGQRSDLWRIALVEASDRPLTGVGEGGYRFGYYEERRSDRNLADPHGLLFRVAAELGAVGLICLLAFAAALIAAVASRWRTASMARRRQSSALLALGVVGVAQGTVDWLWLIPGVTGPAVLGLGLGLAVLRPDREPPAAARASGVRRRTLVAGAALLAAAAMVGFVYLGDVHLRDARAVAPADPRERLAAADRAARLNPWSPQPLYLQASALEDLRRRPAARACLMEALKLEPRSFVTLALLGDLELRAGRPRAARAFYRRALQLNPRDAGLRDLARGRM